MGLFISNPFNLQFIVGLSFKIVELEVKIASFCDLNKCE